MPRRVIGLLVVLCLVAVAAPVASARPANAHKLSAHAKNAERKRLLKALKKNPRLIRQRNFIKRASLVNFKLPISVRLRGATAATNPNLATIDLGTSLGQRKIGLGGSLSGEITFHDSYDGGALGNVDLTLSPGTKTLTSTSIPLLWNTNTTDPLSSIAPTFNLGSGTAGCGNFHGNSPVAIGGNSTVPYWNTQADYDANLAPAGYVPITPGVDDPSKLLASPAVGSLDNLGPNGNPFPYSSQSAPGGFAQPPNVGDTIFRTTPLSLGIATPGTEVNQSNSSANGPQGSQNIVLGKSGGQANLFGNIPGKSYGIDVSVNLSTRINSILRAMDPDFAPLIANKPWPTTFSNCEQAYTGAVQNYIPAVHLKGSLKISPGITSDGKLRIAKATLNQLGDPTRIALAACLYPYSLYKAENNNSDTAAQTVGSYTSGGQLPTNDYVARSAPTNVNCGATPTKLVQDAPVNDILPASGADGYTTSVDGKRVSVAGDLTVDTISADILIGDSDAPPPSPPSSSYYLALGDSIAYGYQSALFATTPNPAVFNFGYVDNFAAHIQQTNPGLTVVNDGCPGETTNSLINGFNPAAGLCGRGSGFPYALLHHSYGIGSTQLQDAVSFLNAHPNTTSPVSLNIGANDLLVFLGSCGFGTPGYNPSCVQSGLAGVQNAIVSNTRTILNQIQAAAPNANFIVMGLYNPYPTVINIGGVGGDSVIANLNSQIRAIALNHGMHFVDPLPVFNPGGSAGGSETGDVPAICALTGMCPGGTFNPANPSADIHPSKQGYKALASLFESASGL
jgi:lysophospholipase L1-like esterase